MKKVNTAIHRTDFQRRYKRPPPKRVARVRRMNLENWLKY
jgi:hypothetical protein